MGRAWQRGRREEGNSERDTLRPVRFIGIVPFRVDLFALVLNPAHSKIAVRLGKGSARVDVARFGIQFIVYIQRPGFVPHLLRSGMK